MVNCHQNTEAADLLGGLRPLRGRDLLVSELRERGQEFLGQAAAACAIGGTEAEMEITLDGLDVDAVIKALEVSNLTGLQKMK